MDAAARSALIQTHQRLVQRAASLYAARVAGYVERDDLVSMGNLGLLEAVDRFDPASGASFATFAWYRVQGAIVDGLRSSAKVPRRAWAQLQALRAAGELLEGKLRQERAAAEAGAPPSTDTAARLAALRETLGELETVFAVSVVSIDDAGDPADPSEPADRRMDRLALARRLAEAIDGLPERERAIVRGHYLEGMSLQDAGAALGLSRSWASRLHAQAIARLRKRLGPVDSS